jgi:hypothetical protein
VDASEYLSIELHQDASFGAVCLGQAILYQLQTLSPQDEVVERWVDLKPRSGKKDQVSGKVHLRVYYSTVKETRSMMDKNQLETEDVFMYNYYKHLFKTGDLISFSGVGITASATKVVTNAPFSHTGVILRLPNRYTQEPELFVLESTRNIDGFVDPFTEERDYGVNIFKLYERLHQFHGVSIWWSPLRFAVDERLYLQTIEWLWGIYKLNKNLHLKENQKLARDVDQKDLLRAYGPAYDFLVRKFGLGKSAFDFCEMASCDLATRFVVRMGLLNPEGVSSVPSPLDVVNFGCYNRPVLIRVKKRYFTPAMLPPEHQPNLPPELAALNNTPDGPNAPISPMAIQPQSQWMPNVNRFKDQELASRNKEESPDDLLDLSDDNLVSIMTTGAKVLYFQKNKPPKHKRLRLSEDETELWCGHYMYVSIQDIEEVRLGQNTHVFDKQKKFADNLDKWSFSVMYGKRGKYGTLCTAVIASCYI